MHCVLHRCKKLALHWRHDNFSQDHPKSKNQRYSLITHVLLSRYPRTVLRNNWAMIAKCLNDRVPETWVFRPKMLRKKNWVYENSQYKVARKPV